MIRILMTNDDGIEAPGMRALVASVLHAVKNTGAVADLWVIAPDRGRSECGHSVTNGRPLQLVSRTDLFEESVTAFSVDGTPVDCVRAAKFGLMQHIDLVFSGVNAGANVGVDLMVSGTFAAAREAACHRIPAMAISHYRRPDIPKTWDHVPAWTSKAILGFMSDADSWSSNASRSANTDVPLLNVNLPAIEPRQDSVPDMVECDVDQSPVPRTGIRVNDQLTYELDFHGRPRVAGQDVDQCFGGHITISRLNAIAGA